MVGTLVRGCRCATSWCDLDLTFHIAVVTLIYKILSGLYLGNSKHYLELYVTETALKVYFIFYGVENYFPTLWGTGIFDAIV